MAQLYWYYYPKMKNFFTKEDGGVGIIEIILIIVVVVGLAFIFRDKLKELIDTIFGDIGDTSQLNTAPKKTTK